MKTSTHPNTLNKIFFKSSITILTLLVILTSTSKSYAAKWQAALASSSQVTAGTICSGNTLAPIYEFDATMANGVGVAGSVPNLQSVSFTTTGTYVAGDVVNYKLWYNATGGTFLKESYALAATLPSSGTGAHTFTLSTPLDMSNDGVTYYFYITVELSASAVAAHTIRVTPAIANSNLTFESGTTGGANGATAGGIQTIATSPAAITGGVTDICVGSTTTYTDATGSGVWSVSNAGVASVAGGVVTGLALGTAVVSYTTGGVCSQTKTVNVNSQAPAAPVISPASSTICNGGNVTLSVPAATTALNITEGWENGVPNTIGVAVDGWNCLGPDENRFSQLSISKNPIVVVAEEGNSFLRYNCYGGSSGQNGTLYSPSFSMVGRYQGKVTFWVFRDNSSPTSNTYNTEGFTVYINTSPDLTSSPTALGFVPRQASTAISGTNITGTSTTTVSGWYQYTCTFPTSYNGATNYILIKCLSKYGYNCYLDDIKITASVPTSPVWSPVTDLFTDAGVTAYASGATNSVNVYPTTVVANVTRTYTATTSAGGCTASGTRDVTINVAPTALTGTPTTLCVSGGTTTTTLTESITGGTWSSSNSSAATVTNAGLVSAGSQGTTTISYSNGCGSPVTQVITVNAVPASITGSPTTLCLSGGTTTTTLANTSTGGTWSSSTTAASVNSSGVITATGQGTTTISYANGCGSAATQVITVNDVPASITGSPTTLCVSGGAATTTLANTSTGGTWSSSTSSVATVDNAGLVSKGSQGTTTISYSNGCGSAATQVITVSAAPASITGSPTTLCLSGGTTTTTLANTSTGGTWSSSTTAASVDNSGVVTATGQGTTTISYANGCGSAATQVITVNAVPATITGSPTTLCVSGGAATTTLANTSTGGTWSSSTSSVATVDNAGLVSKGSQGTTTISYSNGCGSAATQVITVSAAPASITGSPTTLCLSGGTTTTTLANTSTGGTWSSSTTAASVNGSGVVTAAAQGTTTISYDNGCGTAATQIITVNAVPASITGSPTTLCVSGTTTLANTSTGGTWSSSTTAASVNGSGVVTAAAQGTTTISYANGCGSASTQVITVNAVPASITGSPTTLCVSGGTTTTTLANTSTGGTWSSSTTAASVNSSGVVTAAAQGTTTISYDNGCGTAATQVITVNAVPASITGSPTTLCVSGTTTLANTSTGGTWSSSTTAASVNSSGVVTAAAQGTTTISYANGCGSAATQVITVNAVPASITGSPTTLCVSGGTTTTTLANTSTGGTWSSSTTAASVDNSGVVTAAAQGTTTISYANGCGSAATQVITVNAVPASITGSPTTLCVSGGTTTTTLANTSTGGTWSSSTTAASVNGSGVVTAAAQGTTTISYDNGCGSAATQVITVNAVSASITGSPTTLCVSGGTTTTTLANTSTGGTWSSSTTAASVNSSGVVTAAAQGTTTISYDNGCGSAATQLITVNAVPASITGSPTTLCVSGTTTLANTSTGGTWSISTTAASVNGSGVVTAAAQGTTTISYANGCGSAATQVITVNDVPATITGSPTTLCVSGGTTTTTLANTSTGGTWSSSTTAASVNSSGVVTAAAQGTTTISYDNGCGSPATQLITVNVVPASITGSPTTLCVSGGTTTTTLANTSTGGTWSSSTTAANVNSSGVVTAAAQGTTTISYANGCGAAATQVITVNAVPASITGNTQMCTNGSPITLMNTSTGGTWSGGLAGTAVVNSTTGEVTPGAAQGTAIINYSNGCGTAASVTATVNTTPAGISGNAQMCVAGGTITLTNSVTNGTWSSSDPSVADVNAATGVVTAGMQGTAIISYDNGCGAAATVTATVNNTPAGISGVARLCTGGNNTTLANSSTNGTWSGGNTAVATINTNTGVVTSGNTAGTVMFTYSNGCGVAANKIVTVATTPASITGNAPVCSGGSTITLANTSAYGTWISSDPSVASVDLFSGVVTSGNAGNAVITYDNGCGTAAVTTVTVNPNPMIQTFTGGGGYCAGGIGVDIGLTLSNTGIEYTLYTGTTPVSAAVSGTGGPISFGTYLAPGYYYAIATNATGTCSSTLPGVTVHVDPLPDAFAVTGGGSYCSSNPTGVDVSLSGSAVGVDYQLYESGTPVGAPVAGTGSAISFGLQLAGNYTAIATNTATGCTMVMTGAAVVDLFASPTAYNVTGGGTYCLGGSGVLVGLDGSDAGTNYQLVYLGFIPVGGAVAGTGSAFDFGTQFLPGAYTVIATNTNGCVDTMTGDATLTFSLPPAFQFVGGGGGYCLGDSGVHITLSGSATGVKYQLYRADTAVGAAVAGTGAPLDFGLFTTVGTYTVLATDTTTGCTSNMFLSATVTVNPVVAPTVTLSTGLGSGNHVCYGNPVTFTAQTTNGGTAPVYEWLVNNVSIPGPIDSVFTYVPVDSDVVWVKMTSNSLCAVPDKAVNAMTIEVDTFVTPSVFIDVNPQTSVTPGTLVTATAIVTNGGPAPLYQWYKNGAAIPGATNTTYSNNGFVNGDSLTVRVITSGGCGGTVTFNSVVITVFNVSVPNTPALISDVRLIPNPNKGSFVVSGTLATTEDVDANIEVVNMLGQTVYSGKVMVKKGVLNAQVQLSTTLANGMYMLNLQSGTDRKVFHFVLEQ